MRCERDCHNLELVVFELHDAHALRSSAYLADFVRLHSDDNAAVGDHHNVGVRRDNFEAYQRTRLVVERACFDALARSVLNGIIVNARTLAVAV